MSRKLSLRRELFYKNIDVLLTSNSLHTVEEEYGQEEEQNQVCLVVYNRRDKVRI